MNKVIVYILVFMGIIFTIITSVLLIDLILYGLRVNTHTILYPHMYEDDIKLKNLKSRYKVTENFTDKVEEGRNIIKNKKVVIYGLARDVSGVIESGLNIVSGLGKGFEDYKIVIFENDSSDNTRDIIKSRAKIDKNIILITCCNEGDCDCKLKMKHPKVDGAMVKSRIEKMAQIRNRCLNYIKENLHDYDYVVSVDLDIAGGIFLDGYVSAFANKNWDVLAARGLHPIPLIHSLSIIPSFKPEIIYDAFAFTPFGVDNEYEQKYYVKHHFVQQELQKNKIGSDPVRVNSAFNGLAIYKMESILPDNVLYGHKTRCEHTDLHISILNNNGRIYLDPSIIINIGLDYRNENPLLTLYKQFI
jgi:hypothetical protein